MRIYSLYDIKGRYEINIISSINDFDKLINLNDNVIRDRLSFWFENKHNNSKYSCVGFLYYMMTGINFSPVISWNFQKTFDKNNYIYLSSTKNTKDFHCALYIEEYDIYLSQFGNGGEIVLTKLDNMARYFETDKIEYVTMLQPDI
jgi:hypothetical protein